LNGAISCGLNVVRGSARRGRLWITIAAIAILLSAGAGAGASARPASSEVRPPINRDSQPKGRLIFDANFSGKNLNPAIWDTCYPWAKDPATGCTNFGNPDEYEWYLPSQVSVANGDLNLVAQNLLTPGRSATGGPQEYVCRSGMATTYPGFQFQYGYVQVVAHFPDTVGLWSALWLAAANWQWPPEIDMVEYWVRKVKPVGVYFHAVGGTLLKVHPHVNLGVGWHTYALDWTPTQLTWYIDGHVVLSTRQNVPDQPMYFLATLAYSSAKPSLIETGSGCHGTLEIKSIQVWKQ
jgi:beta-glucanase (GH16 family)